MNMTNRRTPDSANGLKDGTTKAFHRVTGCGAGTLKKAKSARGAIPYENVYVTQAHTTVFCAHGPLGHRVVQACTKPNACWEECHLPLTLARPKNRLPSPSPTLLTVWRSFTRLQFSTSFRSRGEEWLWRLTNLIVIDLCTFWIRLNTIEGSMDKWW